MNKRYDITYTLKILPFAEFKHLLQRGAVSQIMAGGWLYHVTVGHTGVVFVIRFTKDGATYLNMAALYGLYKFGHAHLLN